MFLNFDLDLQTVLLKSNFLETMDEDKENYQKCLDFKNSLLRDAELLNDSLSQKLLESEKNCQILKTENEKTQIELNLEKEKMFESFLREKSHSMEKENHFQSISESLQKIEGKCKMMEEIICKFEIEIKNLKIDILKKKFISKFCSSKINEFDQRITSIYYNFALILKLFKLKFLFLYLKIYHFSYQFEKSQ